MRHRIKKIKFKSGRGANKMMTRKLIVNFIRQGKITTTLKRVKILKAQIEKLVEKMKVKNEANKNKLLSVVGDERLIPKMFEDIGKPLKERVGGYVKIVRLGARQSDSAEVAMLEWAYPIITNKEIKGKKAKESQETQKKK
ncbi:50S ribosomal protein L17 [Candidatus Roizmanbacteria bacterium RIFCSPHIGHO2_01_FULL_39_8]|uniref:50S ribosomal protein L17 n=3 Tax=Candidatus Roizmaniibacteriota TaxID=1752723 RepID=A0A1F7GTN5_9BACT|nr:MAG: 50S ribosomal protein L17 [Candidatus Roizmanbacteria bacterium RIFCSPHIGHO2_01_FULL_39_8]